jgi:hypothetical protein
MSESASTTEQQDSVQQVQEEEKEATSKLFKCHICQLQASYDYFGNRPMDRHLQPEEQKNVAKRRGESVVLLEKAFVRDDPFSELKSANYLVLGSICSECQQMVCVGNECSFFYFKKRLCAKCAKPYLSTQQTNSELPIQLVAEIQKNFK